MAKQEKKSSVESRKQLHDNAFLQGSILITSSTNTYVIVQDGIGYEATNDIGYSAKFPNIIIAMKSISKHIESNEGYNN